MLTWALYKRLLLKPVLEAFVKDTKVVNFDMSGCESINALALSFKRTLSNGYIVETVLVIMSSAVFYGICANAFQPQICATHYNISVFFYYIFNAHCAQSPSN